MSALVSALLGLTIGELGWAGLCVLLLVLAVGVVVSGSDERLEDRLWCAERGGGEGGVGGLGGGQTAAGHANSCWYLERMNAMSAGGGLASAWGVGRRCECEWGRAQRASPSSSDAERVSRPAKAPKGAPK